jgi:hypothetical protein
MWEPRPLTRLWASTACHRDSFSFVEGIELLLRIRAFPDLKLALETDDLKLLAIFLIPTQYIYGDI